VPLRVGVETSVGGGSVGLNLVGAYFQDFTPVGGVARPLAQRGFVAFPSLTLRVPLGPAVGHFEAGYVAHRLLALSGDPQASDVRQYARGGAGLTVALSPSLELAASVVADVPVRAAFAPRLESQLRAQLRSPGSATAYFARYGLLFDPGSFDEGLLKNLFSIGASFAVLEALRVSPVVSAALEQKSQLYETMLRVEGRPTEELLLWGDYRVQHLALVDRSGAFHYLTVGLDFDLTAFARVGTYASVKQVGSADALGHSDQQWFVRGQLHF
jgi:hypothetical protein